MEDEAGIRSALKQLLETQGFAVEVAHQELGGSYGFGQEVVGADAQRLVEGVDVIAR